VMHYGHFARKPTHVRGGGFSAERHLKISVTSPSGQYTANAVIGDVSPLLMSFDVNEGAVTNVDLIQETENEQTETSAASKSPASSKFDIGLYLTAPNTDVDDSLKLKLTTEPWIPEPSFSFPVEGSRRLRFQMHWLQ
jgi:hypothetical protein